MAGEELPVDEIVNHAHVDWGIDRGKFFFFLQKNRREKYIYIYSFILFVVRII